MADHEHSWVGTPPLCPCGTSPVEAYAEARDTIRRLEGELGLHKLNEHGQCPMCYVAGYTDGEAATAALVVELRRRLDYMEERFPADPLEDAINALDTSAAERLLAERDARVVEPYKDVINSMLGPEYEQFREAARALLGRSGAPTTEGQ